MATMAVATEACVSPVRRTLCRLISDGHSGTLETPSLGNLAWALATTASLGTTDAKVVRRILEELLHRTGLLPESSAPRTSLWCRKVSQSASASLLPGLFVLLFC